MAAVAGKGGTVVYDGGSVATLKEWSLDISPDIHDVTPFTTSAPAWKDFIAGLNSWTGSLSGTFDPASTGQNNLINAARELRAMGPATVIIKKGEHGALLFEGDDVFGLPALPLSNVVDPTGAGDTFAGALLGSLAHQVFPSVAPFVDGDDSPDRGILAELTLRDGTVESIEVLPVDIYHAEPPDDESVRSPTSSRLYSSDQDELYGGVLGRIGARMTFLRRRSTAELATGSLALDILESFRARSGNYGTEVEIRGERALILLNGSD